MSKARLVITAVVVEGRSQREVARAYGVSQGWVSRLVARYRAEGEAAFAPRSRRPKTSPAAIGDRTAELIIAVRKDLAGQGLDAGPETICWHLAHHHQIRVSRATVGRYLARAGLVTPEPAKRPRSSYLRFEATQPNECWQADFTHYPLADGTGTEVLTWLDDHSRLALNVTAHRRVTGPIVLAAFRAAVAAYGAPASTLTDNGLVFTARFAGGRGGRNGLETELRRLGITQKNGKPNHPQTQGKVERFQQTMKKWLAAQQPQPATISQLQALLDPSPASTTTGGHTVPSPIRPPRPPLMPPGPKPAPATAPATPTTGSGPTSSATAAPSRSAPAASFTTSASAGSTPAPPS
jgi:transposase InsO family protein